MKIWEVALGLANKGGGEWFTHTSVDMNNAEYAKVGDKYWEVKGLYIRHSIPTQIEVKRISGAYLAECGYEYQPTSEELKEIEKQMKQAIFDYIEEEFSQQVTEHELKLRGLGDDYHE